ncbi:hypothetical protein F4818DRAFT_220406 [Hypoxylon cercidicola]|nr:hypothetical protein F4818DRAFT_220406 [Hypoxylon cercidicola]
MSALMPRALKHCRAAVCSWYQDTGPAALSHREDKTCQLQRTHMSKTNFWQLPRTSYRSRSTGGHFPDPLCEKRSNTVCFGPKKVCTRTGSLRGTNRCADVTIFKPHVEIHLLYTRRRAVVILAQSLINSGYHSTKNSSCTLGSSHNRSEISATHLDSRGVSPPVCSGALGIKNMQPSVASFWTRVRSLGRKSPASCLPPESSFGASKPANGMDSVSCLKWN